MRKESLGDEGRQGAKELSEKFFSVIKIRGELENFFCIRIAFFHISLQ